MKAVGKWLAGVLGAVAVGVILLAITWAVLTYLGVDIK